MKDFRLFGIKKRVYPEHNYNAIWKDLLTIRLGEGVARELPPDRAEFYDVSLGNKCNVECPFCYTSAIKGGVHYEDICETWTKWMSTFPEDIKKNEVTYTEKPFQIAIGSEGEPTIHPNFLRFLSTIFHTGVVPNYTTNGITLSKGDDFSNQLLEATSKYVGGVAVSFGNTSIRSQAKKAVEALISKGNTKVNIHHILSDRNSVQDFVDTWSEYGDDIAYHVILPLMPNGRSNKGMDEDAFKLLEHVILDLDIKNVAFGAHLVEALKGSKIKTYLYPPESLSKNVLLKKDEVVITPSSFNLNPVKIIKL